MRPIAILLSCVLASSTFAEAGAAATVRGTLWMSRDAQAAAKAKTAGVPALQRGVTDAVLWIETVPPSVENKLAGAGGWGPFRHKPRPPAVRAVSQEQHQFDPRVVVLTRGDRVAFTNADRVYHNAFSVSTAKRFDLGKYPPGRSDTIAFDRSGVINVHCDIHPDEMGFLVVTPNHASVRPDARGAFELPKLPPGHYTLHAWHAQRGELQRAFDVPRHGDVSLELRF